MIILLIKMGADDDDKKVRYTKSDVQFQTKYMKYKAKYLRTKIHDSQRGGDNEQQDNLSNWINRQDNGPVVVYHDIVKKYGEPTYCENIPKGVCKWIKGQTNNDISPHEIIMLKDEFVHHTKPAEHYDFLYSVVKVYIPPESLVDVIKISGSINYDPLKKYLRARCASFAANFATLRTVFDVIDKKSSDYGTNINKKDDEKQSNEEYVKMKVKENQERYALELAKPYYDLDKVKC